MEDRGAELVPSNGSRSVDHSAALAEKLLQGWALLQEHCPQCLTPLVRNRQRKMYCVACTQWVISQTEAAEQLARERVEKGGGESTSDPPPLPLPLPEPASSGLISSPLNNDQNGRQQPTLSSPAQNSPSIRASQNSAGAHVVPQSTNTGNARSTLLIPKLNYHPKTLEQVLPNISFILVHKLEEIGNALLASQDVNDMRMLMSALRECLQALDSLKTL